MNAAPHLTPETKVPRSPGSQFIQRDALPAAVLTHLASFQGDTLSDIAMDIPTTTILAVQTAAGSLQRRRFIRWNKRTEVYEVTKAGHLAISEMMKRQ